MAQFLAPIINSQQEDSNGAPLSGGTIEVYLAGTSTPATTYSDKAGAVPNTWPIVLNTLGVNNQGAVWLTGGASYKYVIKNSLGVVQRTIDNVSGINDTAVTTDQWIVFQGTPTYVSATSFTLAGDQTQTFQINRRIKTANTGGTITSTITNSVYSSPNTTVTVRNDSGVLDSGLSQVSYGIISVQNSSVTGLMLRATVYSRIAGVQNVSVDGGTPTTTGATTFSTLPGTTFYIVEAIGGGGGGGGAPATAAGQVSGGGNGGGGGYTVGRFTGALSGAAVIVGTAGTGGAAGGAGTAGGTTSLAALITALGGAGATVAAAAAGVNIDGFNGAAVGSGGNILALQGNASGFSSLTAAAGGGIAAGAAGPKGGSVRGQSVTAKGVAGLTPTAPGAGGSGAANNASQAARSGGDGAPGLLIIWEFA